MADETRGVPLSEVNTNRIVERKFQAQKPAGKIQEIYNLAHFLNLEPADAIIRIFNSGNIMAMRQFGTDRARLDEIDTREYSPDAAEEDGGFGYETVLRVKNLRLDDGLFAMPLSHFTPFTKGLFEEDVLSIAPQRAAIAIYRNSLLAPIEENELAEEDRHPHEYYYFKDPKNKRDALAGILLQEPNSLDVQFQAVPGTSGKIEFVSRLLGRWERGTQYLIRDFILDLKREIVKELYDDSTNQELKGQLREVNSLLGKYYSFDHQQTTIDEMRDQINMIKKGEGRLRDDLQMRQSWKIFILQQLQEQLNDPLLSDTNRADIERLLREADGLN